MIDYKPLADTLKSKGIRLSELCDLTGLSENSLMCKMNNNEYIPLMAVDKICSVLDIQVKDVIGYKKGKQKVSEKFNVNWGFITEQLEVKGISLNELSERCRLDKSALSHAKRRNSKISEWTLKMIATQLGCNVENVKFFAPSGEENI